MNIVAVNVKNMLIIERKASQPSRKAANIAAPGLTLRFAQS